MLLWHHRQLVDTPVIDDEVWVTAVNGQGQVAGDTSSGTPFVYSDGGYRFLPGPDHETAYTIGINSAGDVVGRVTYGDANQTILWPAARPGTYEIIGRGRPLGIDDAGHVVTESGEIRSADGTTVRLPGYPSVFVELFQGGRIIGRNWNNTKRLLEWNVNGNLVRWIDLAVTSPMSINSNGQLATWYFKSGNRNNTVGVWRQGVFVGDVGNKMLNVWAVTDTDELAGGHQPVPDADWVPATWACVTRV